MTGVPVTRPDDVETTARGAAMLAAVGAGMYGDGARGRARDGGAADRAGSSPIPATAEVYEDLHGRYRELYAALRPMFDALPA